MDTPGGLTVEALSVIDPTGLKIRFPYNKRNDDVSFKHHMLSLGALRVFVNYGKHGCTGIAFVIFDSPGRMESIRKKLPLDYRASTPTPREIQKYIDKVRRQIPSPDTPRVYINIPIVVQYFCIPFETSSFFMMNGHPYMYLNQLNYLPDHIIQEYLVAHDPAHTPIRVKQCLQCLMFKPAGLNTCLWNNHRAFSQVGAPCKQCRNNRKPQHYQNYLRTSVYVIKEFVDKTCNDPYLQSTLFQPEIRPNAITLEAFKYMKYSAIYLKCRLVCLAWFKELPCVHAVRLEMDDAQEVLETEEAVEVWQISFHCYPQVYQRFKQINEGAVK